MDVLELLARQPEPLEASTIARMCGIPRSSTYHLINALHARGFLTTHDGRRWSIGPRLAELAAGAPALGEAFALLDAFGSDSQRVDPPELVRRTGLHVVTVARLLDLLVAEHLVTAHDDGGYALGARLAGVANRFGALERLRAEARPLLVRLRDETLETANLLVREGDAAVYLEQVESRYALRHASWIGRRIPLAASASGRAFLDPAGTHALSDGVEAGITAVAAAVPGAAAPQAVISVTGPSTRLSGEAAERVAALVAAAAAEAGRRLASET